MPEQPGAGRLDAETLAAYVDGLLPPEERAKVDAEIAADPESYEWLVSTISAVEDDSIEGAGEVPVRPVSSERGPTPTPASTHAPTPVHGTTPSPGPGAHGGTDVPAKVLPFYRRRAVMAGVGVLVATAASLLLVMQLQPEWYQRWRGPQVDPRFAKLVEAVGEERYIEARLTGGFKYGPLRQVMRGPNDLSKQNLQLLAAAGELQKAAEKDPSSENLHAWGVAQVLSGKYDLATAVLEQSTRVGPTGEAFADLAAAYLARAQALGRTDDPSLALSSADHALAISPNLAEAMFNRALALETVGRPIEAGIEWERFLAENSDPWWFTEATRRLLTIRRRYPAGARR